MPAIVLLTLHQRFTVAVGGIPSLLYLYLIFRIAFDGAEIVGDGRKTQGRIINIIIIIIIIISYIF